MRMSVDCLSVPIEKAVYRIALVNQKIQFIPYKTSLMEGQQIMEGMAVFEQWDNMRWVAECVHGSIKHSGMSSVQWK